MASSLGLELIESGRAAAPDASDEYESPTPGDAATAAIAVDVLVSAAVAEGCGSDPLPDARLRRGLDGGAGAGGAAPLLSSGCDREFFLAMAFLDTQITTIVHARRRKNRRTDVVLRRLDVTLQTIRQRDGRPCRASYLSSFKIPVSGMRTHSGRLFNSYSSSYTALSSTNARSNRVKAYGGGNSSDVPILEL
jgi:hypothetical protein